MASNLKTSALDYGVVIAFLAPGFVAFAGASEAIPRIVTWMTAAAETEQTVGIFLFVLLASLSIGLAVSGVRALVIDHLLRWRLLGKFAVPQLQLDWGRVDEENLPVLITIRDSHYRYYQFYSNTLVALVFAGIVRLIWGTTSSSWELILVLVLIIVILFLSARESLLHYVTGMNQALTPLSTEDHNVQRLSPSAPKEEDEEKEEGH
jgi:hypothetical protein